MFLEKPFCLLENRVLGKSVLEAGKLVRRPLERGIWVRGDGEFNKQRLWLLFKDGRCVGIWGFVGYERGIKVNMEVSA